MNWLFIGGGILLIVIVWRFVIYLWDRKHILILPSGKRIPKVRYINHTSTLTNKSYKVKIVYNSRIGRLLTPSNFIAITIWNRIYICGNPTNVYDTLETHELRHTEQWKQLGFIKFLTTYYKESKNGYDCNALEEDARQYAKEDLRCNG